MTRRFNKYWILFVSLLASETEHRVGSSWIRISLDNLETTQSLGHTYLYPRSPWFILNLGKSTRNILAVQSVDWCFVQKSTSCWLSSMNIYNFGHTMLLLLDILVKYGHWLAAPLALTSVIKRGHQLKLDTKAFFFFFVAAQQPFSM